MANRKKLGSPNPETLKNSSVRKAHPLSPLTHLPKSQNHASSPGKTGGGTLYLPKMLIGHRDSAVDFYIETLNRVLELPENMRPDTIIISDSLHGIKKIQHTTHENIDTAYQQASRLLEKALETGADVIYDMSHDDRLIDHLHIANEKLEEV